MRELLIRYLLGELDAYQQRQVEERLRTSRELRSELAYLRACFAAARETEQEPEVLPRRLAERTAQRIAGAGCSDELESTELESRADFASGRTASAAVDPPAGPLGWSLADLTVAGGVFLALSMLVFPALRDSRDATRATICQDHQQQLFVLLTRAAENNNGYFPRIEQGQNAGMFAVELVENELIDPSELALILVCPAAPLADKIRAGEFVVRIPTRAELANMSPVELTLARRQMSPFLGYQFPFRIGNRHFYRRDDRQPFAPILCDASDSESGEMMSVNHHGIVQVLFADGHVRLFKSSHVPALGDDDDLYRNALGMVAAGCSPGDAVLGRSEAVLPRIEFTINRQ